MKILEINKFNFLVGGGGAETHFQDLIDLLQANGHEVAVFSMRHRHNLSSGWEKYFVSTVGYSRQYSFWQRLKGTGRIFHSFEAKRKLAELLDDFHPEIVHLHNIYHHLSFGILSVIKQRKIPIVMTVHDYELVSPDREVYDEQIGSQYWKFLMVKKYSFLQRLLLVVKKYIYSPQRIDRLVDRFVVPSYFLQRILVKAGITESKISVRPHFIREIPFDRQGEEVGNIPYAFYFGRLIPGKGIDQLVAMFRDLKGGQLYLAGSTQDGYKIPRRDNVVHLGHLSPGEVRRYIRKSALVVSASRLPETFGLIGMEALAEGKPFVALASGAYSELVENGVNGWICQDTTEMKKVIEKIFNRELPFDEQAIQAAAKEKYGSEKYLKELLNVFEEAKNGQAN
ncbi:glycosyltransferase [Patescibacteria group bacterium]|nr:MAG: glycosyltransferase [Patescibacteria group bacterium]